jgi:phospholipid/cholesterol/gamma-HCH transport system substrate-binding protein
MPEGKWNKMPAATNVKVGVTVTVFFIILTLVVIWFSQYNPGKKFYVLEGKFKNVGGLLTGSKVYLMGVEVGKVDTLTPELNTVKVLMDIDTEIKIPTNTRLAITSKGLVGDKCVEFLVDSSEMPKGFYPPGALIEGNSPANFEDVIVETKKTLQLTQKMIGDPELNRNLKQTTRNVEKFTRQLGESIKQINLVSENIKGFVGNTNHTVDDINLFVGDLRGFTTSNRDNINNIISNSNRISRSLDTFANNVNGLLEDPANKRDLKLTMKSIRGAADNIQYITGKASKVTDNVTMITSDIHDVTGDNDLKNNLKDIVKNTKVISGTFANTLNTNKDDKDKDKDKDKKDRLNLEFRSELLGKVNYQFKANTATTFDVIGNFNILAHTGFAQFPFIELGVEEIGATNQFNVQAGFYPFDNLMVRLGLIKGKLGIGSNYFVGLTNTEIIAETYDISSPHVRLGLLQKIYNNYGLSAYWDNHFSTNQNEFILGVRWQPGIF